MWEGFGYWDGMIPPECGVHAVQEWGYDVGSVPHHALSRIWQETCPRQLGGSLVDLLFHVNAYPRFSFFWLIPCFHCCVAFPFLPEWFVLFPPDNKKIFVRFMRSASR